MKNVKLKENENIRIKCGTICIIYEPIRIILLRTIKDFIFSYFTAIEFIIAFVLFRFTSKVDFLRNIKLFTTMESG